MCKKKEYLFIGVFDIVIYMVLTIIYPCIEYGFQFPDAKTPQTIYETLITGLLFTGAFFYDFYTKYESSEAKSAFVLTVLLLGDIFYAIASLLIILLLIVLIFDAGYVCQIYSVFRFIPLIAILPLLLSLHELIVRIYRKHKKKISAISI